MKFWTGVKPLINSAPSWKNSLVRCQGEWCGPLCCVGYKDTEFTCWVSSPSTKPQDLSRSLFSYPLPQSHTFLPMFHFFKSYLELISRWPIWESTSQPYIVGANDLICSRYLRIFDIESNQYNRSLLSFIGNNHSFICSINIEWLWWPGYCDRSILEMQCSTHWSDLNGGSLRHLGRQAFWLLSSHINSMGIDSAYLKKWSHWHHVWKKWWSLILLWKEKYFQVYLGSDELFQM